MCFNLSSNEMSPGIKFQVPPFSIYEGILPIHL